MPEHACAYALALAYANDLPKNLSAEHAADATAYADANANVLPASPTPSPAPSPTSTPL